MREIKFRVRDIVTGKVYQPKEICRIYFNGGKLSAVLLWDETLIVYPELIECTGLKDKNKVEIYFDDLVRDNDGLVYKVKYGGYFSKDGAGWGVHYYQCIPETFPLDADTFGTELNLEVIGNIYENPELIDEPLS